PGRGPRGGWGGSRRSASSTAAWLRASAWASSAGTGARPESTNERYTCARTARSTPSPGSMLVSPARSGGWTGLSFELVHRLAERRGDGLALRRLDQEGRHATGEARRRAVPFDVDPGTAAFSRRQGRLHVAPRRAEVALAHGPSHGVRVRPVVVLLGPDRRTGRLRALLDLGGGLADRIDLVHAGRDPGPDLRPPGREVQEGSANPRRLDGRLDVHLNLRHHASSSVLGILMSTPSKVKGRSGGRLPISLRRRAIDEPAQPTEVNPFGTCHLTISVVV